MKNGFVIFLAAFAVLASSWGAFVLAPQLQLGGAKQVSVLNSSDVYPPVSYTHLDVYKRQWWFLSSRLRYWSLRQDVTGDALCTHKMRFHSGLSLIHISCGRSSVRR